MPPITLDLLFGPLGLLFGFLALGGLIYRGNLRFGREYDAMVVEKDRQLVAMTKDRDDWKNNSQGLQQLLERKVEADATIATANVRGRKAGTA